jgi:hypothetical protein
MYHRPVAAALAAAILATASGAAALGPIERPVAPSGAPASSAPLGPKMPGTAELPLPPPMQHGDDAPVAKQRGVALGMFAEDVGFSYTPLLREIAALGATHVSLVVPLYQTDAASTSLYLHTRFSPTLELLADTIRAARRERLEVTVFPIVRLATPGPGEWRGTLAPKNRNAWFKSYGELLGDLAAVAAQTGATRLVIGSELSTLDGDLEHWQPLLERIRAVFPGKLVYSANWDHYRDAKLFDLVDEEGVVAYFRLRESAKAPDTEAALASAWRKHKDDILEWHSDRTRPLVLTEVGYRSRAGSTVAPWDETSGGTPDLEEQRRAFAAFRQVWSGEPRLDGAYVWNWYGWGGKDSVGYTPRGKPAEQEVRRLLDGL